MIASNAEPDARGGPFNDTLGWMLDDALTVPGARHAVLLSADGLLRAHSRHISRDDADRQAAALSALQSISRNAIDVADQSDGEWRQTLVEFGETFLLLIAAGPGAYLAVSTDADADMEAVAYRMHKLVDRLGKELTVQARRGIGRTA